MKGQDHQDLQGVQTAKSPKAMKIKVVRFQAWHVEHLLPIPEQQIDLYLKYGEGFTLLLDGEPIAAAGVIFSGGKGSAWGLIPHGKARSLPVALYKSVIRGMQGIIERNDLRRVDVIIDPKDRANVPWVRHLGFHYEGPMCDFYAVGHHAEYWARTTSRCGTITPNKPYFSEARSDDQR